MGEIELGFGSCPSQAEGALALSFQCRDIRGTSARGVVGHGKGLTAQTMEPSSLPECWKEKAAPMLLQLPRLPGEVIESSGLEKITCKIVVSGHIFCCHILLPDHLQE
ncbi:uncharacterized protein GJ701_008639 isoform 2-T2 [Geothlypis trichas]